MDAPLLIARLRVAYPDARCALTHENPLQLLVATILSAQCTDARVNQVTPVLFGRYPDAAALMDADLGDLEAIIRSTGFYRNKAKSIRGAARTIVERFGGEVPRTMDELLTLPGVARKTANVVLGTAYGIGDGIVVDTHVDRLAHRLGLVDESNPEAVERALMKLVPRGDWIDFAHLLIHHGRRICLARAPQCGICPVQDLCPSAAHFLAGGKPATKRALGAARKKAARRRKGAATMATTRAKRAAGPRQGAARRAGPKRAAAARRGKAPGRRVTPGRARSRRGAR